MKSNLPIYLFAPVVAWLAAQVLKRFWDRRYRQSALTDLSFFFESGGMPSSHAAIVTSLLTTIVVREGLGSSSFGVAFVLCVIVMYDAVNVRRAVGEQGTVLAELAEKFGVKTPFHRALGHKLSEVAAGVVIGVLSSLVLLQFM